MPLHTLKSSRHRVVALTFLVLGQTSAVPFGSALAQPELYPIGFLDPTAPTRESLAHGVSGDGTIAVGESLNADGFTEAYYWSDGEIVGLGFLDPSQQFRVSVAYGISADGTTIVGVSENSDTKPEAFRYSGGSMIGLGFLDPSLQSRSSAALAVSGDGAVIVGTSRNSDEFPEAVRWVGGTISGLGFLDPLNLDRRSEAIGVSSDGSVIVGQSRNADGFLEAFRWTSSGIEGLGFLDPSNVARVSRAEGISADGSTVVGFSRNSDDLYEAVRWTGGGVLGLGFLFPDDDPDRTSNAKAASSNGSVIVGFSSSSSDARAFRWTESGGMQSVADWLGPDVDLTGIALREANGVSADGNTIVGNMFHDGFQEAFLARQGGLLTTHDVLASFASISAVADAVDRGIGQAAQNGLRCASSGPSGICAFADLRYEFDPALVGTVGASFQLGEAGRVGFSVGYADQDIELAFGGKAQSGAPVVSLFSGFGKPDGSAGQFFAGLSYGHFQSEIDRGYVNAAGTTTSHGETTLDGFGAYARLGWGASLGEAVLLTPFGDVIGAWASQAEYVESGGPFPASFEARNDASMIARLGVDVDVALTDAVHLLASAAWAHRLVDDADPVSGRLAGLFTANVDPLGESSDWAEASVGTSVELGKSAEVRVELSATIGADKAPIYSAQTGFRRAF